MFGLVVAGRLVQTDAESVDATHCLFRLPSAAGINHIVVFLTGQVPLPHDTAAAVYFSWPTDDGGGGWQYLGLIGNEKPSAIFRVSKLRPQGGPAEFALADSSTMAQIGISLEPKVVVEALQAPEETQASQVSTFAEFSAAMVESFGNFAASFAVTQAEMRPEPGESWVRTAVVAKWMESFRRKLALNPFFWRS